MNFKDCNCELAFDNQSFYTCGTQMNSKVS